jgi:hypothetical protein
MRKNEKKVKDKSIYKKGFRGYLAVVTFFQDTPERDKDRSINRMFEGDMDAFVEAQSYLRRFPPDVWDGFDMFDGRYVEVDER